MIGIVICCGRDKDMLPLFCEQWKKIYPDVWLVLGNCTSDPVNQSDMAEFPIDWNAGAGGRSIFNAMKRASEIYMSDKVLKLDVDCFHRAPIFLEPFRNPKVFAAGIQWLNNPHHFLGAAYGLTRTMIWEIEHIRKEEWWSMNEDVAMSWQARKARPNGIHLFHPSSTIRNAQTDDGTVPIVHCGSFGNDRNKAFKAMKKLAESF
jgi:hypothetical protein